MTPDTLSALLARKKGKQPTVLATRMPDGLTMLYPGEGLGRPLAQASANALAAGRSQKAEIEGETWFLDVHLPPSRLVLVGAVHIAQSLAPMAASFGIEPIVIDPRSSFATEERFPGIALRHDWPDEAVAGLVPDPTTAVVALSHDPKLDDPALIAALASPAFYVGALGSKRSHQARLGRLRAAGVNEHDLSRIRGPVGLAIGSVTTAEIALSILAEIVAVRRGGRAAARS